MTKEFYSKEESRYLKMGIYVCFVVLGILTYFVLSHNDVELDNGKYYSVNARFNRTDGLLIGDWVRMAGMNIGRVVDAKLDEHFKAVLRLEIKDGIKIPDDSSASIVSSGLMGAKYIEVEPGGSEDNIVSGGEFAYTQDAMVLDELLDRIISIGKSNRKKSTEKQVNDGGNNE
ncbi:MAG: MCE family protein [Alphaproteobacteria bacterium]|nr:MCE family protein [Alphaproteobacteria bacterium]